MFSFLRSECFYLSRKQYIKTHLQSYNYNYILLNFY